MVGINKAKPTRRQTFGVQMRKVNAASAQREIILKEGDALLAHIARQKLKMRSRKAAMSAKK